MEYPGNVNMTAEANSTSTFISNSLVSLIPDWIIISVVIFIVIAILVGIPGNTLVLAVLTKNRLKTSTDWFIIFIAICDLVSLTVNGPIDIFRYQTDLWVRIGTPALCKMHYYVISTLFIESNFLILSVGVDRFFKTCRPHGRYFTPARALCFCIAVTAASVICAIPNIYTSTASRSGICMFDRDYIQLRGIYIRCLIAVISISSVLLILIYSRIALVLKRRVDADRNRREQLQRVLQQGLQANSHFYNLKEATGSRRAKRMIGTIEEDSSNGMVLEDATTNQGTRNRSDVTAEGGASRTQTTSLGSVLRHFTSQKSIKVHPIETEPDEMQGPGTSSRYSVQERMTERQISRSCDHDQSKRTRKTTQIIFAITLLYIVSTVIPTVTAPFLTETSLRNYAGGQTFIFLTMRLYTINNFANPLLYMALSSTFRKKSVKIIKSLKPW